MHHHVVELLFRLVQVLGRLQGRDDGEVVRDLGVVEDAFVRLNPSLLENLPRKWSERVDVAQRFEALLDRRQIVLRQRARVGARISQHLVPLVERLSERQCHARWETETAVRFALQAGEIEKQRRELGRGLGLLAGNTLLAATRGDYRCRVGLVP